MKKQFVNLFLFLLLASAVITCRKDHDDDAGLPPVSTGPTSTMTTTISGVVQDEYNKPLAGVSISAYGQTTVTDPYGIFVMANVKVDKNRCLLQFSKAGYLNRDHSFVPVAKVVNYLKIAMLSTALPKTVTVASGASIAIGGGAKIQFPPNAFVKADLSPYMETTAKVYVRHLATDNPNFPYAIPGGDLAGKDTSGKNVALYSFGMMNVEITSSSGEKLQLAPGTPATLTFPVAPGQLANASPTIPMWYYDEKQSLWVEQGQATLSGNVYVGTVSHFSWWNCDYKGERAYINGRVLDCEGNPVSNAEILVDNGYLIMTGSDGRFSTWVPAGFAFVFQAKITVGGTTFVSQVINVPPIAPNQTYTIPDFILLTCPSGIKGELKTCSGEPANGLITLYESNNLIGYIYTIEGKFNFVVPQNSALKLKALSGIYTGVKYCNSPATSTSLDVGSIMLCDTSGVIYLNSYVINGSGYTNQSVVIDTLNTYTDLLYNPFSIGMYMQGYSNFNGQLADMQIYLKDTLPGIYTLGPGTGNFFYLTLHMPSPGSSISQGWNAHQTGASGSVQLVDIEPAGGIAAGKFSGHFMPFDSLTYGTTIQPVDITNGTFFVHRTR